MGVIVRRYIDILTIIINFPYSTCISSFLAAASLLLCSFLNVFSVFIWLTQRNDYNKLLSIETQKTQLGKKENFPAGTR